jgi:hypothetical protein
MTHYVCTGGCGGVSDKPGVCQTASCPLHHHELKPCDCTDGKHAALFAQAEKEKAASGK